MCNHVGCGERTYATPRQLCDLIGGPEGLVWLEHAGEMDWCLCAIDLPKTLERAGLRWMQARGTEILIC
ncbi:hypothetical protein EN792_032475 [Mesorhizobium sp. M00.F.Ca.ET.149.01.1.1]|nr:hypothetical protein EN840_22280 [Mesorhizobium sp. M8A.F.Ca.ET.197.01.1.1]TGR39260.1 hypothetical protein EN842_42325 [bacterium M00.F.Ca.ET.199.01.1.1]TGR46856.1 hypothetical protein EN841_22275 [Mesorhizobium sp. M8A.F.Ca.ET.198.01.1.1]TGV81906.1 hypothetical protein EN792_032475 [Mesorhizobium sp. M00.F.Ca.ET.149.01.1.1]